MPRALVLLPDASWAEPMATYSMLGKQILMPASRPGMPRWQEVMMRLSGSATGCFRLPPGRMVELGSRYEM